MTHEDSTTSFFRETTWLGRHVCPGLLQVNLNHGASSKFSKIVLPDLQNGHISYFIAIVDKPLRKFEAPKVVGNVRCNQIITVPVHLRFWEGDIWQK